MACTAAHTESESRTFGALLQQYRQQAGLTQEGLAERAGISVRGLSDLERGVNATPRRDTLALILDALALDPDRRQALVLAARQRARQSAAQISGVSPATTRFPSPDDPLIGREADLAAIAALLGDPGVRLVTLIGPGGIGKTRLALAAGHERLASGDTVTWVPLAAARSAPVALASMASALGLEDRGTIPLPALLAQALQGRRQLLILDNVEQIPDLAADLSQILAAAPALTILATSRAPLRLRGERRYQAPPLGLGSSPDAASPSPAVMLFTRRATEIDHTFALTPANAAAVQAICSRLDGLPLAIELAAARSAVLSPPALLARLDRALPLLTVGSHDAPDRQRTLRDAIAWSYDLLPSETRHVFRRLGVFLGGFTLSAAEQVCASAAGAPTLDHLQILLEQSLVRAVPDTDPQRYLLLETIREFAAEQLEAAGEAAAAHEAHARWMLGCVREQHGAIFTTNDGRAFSILDAEAANATAALATFVETPGEAVRAAELCDWLNVWWQLRAKGREALSHLDGLLARRDELPPRAVANLLIEASTFRNNRGEDIAEHMAREAVGIHETIKSTTEPDFRSLSMARFYLADCLADPAERCVHYEIGLKYAREGNLVLAEAFLLGSLCLAFGELGQIDDAVSAGTRAIALQQELGGRIGIGQAHSQLGHALRLLDRHAEAVPYLTIAFRNFWDIGAIGWTAQSLEGIAACAAHAQQAERAAWLIGAASQLRLRSGWSVDLELFGRTPETQRALTETFGAQALANLQAAGAAASWQELHDFVMHESAILPG